MKSASRIYLWASGFIWLVALGYSVWISFVFRNPNQTFPHPFMIGVTIYIVVSFFWSCFPPRLAHERQLSLSTLFFVIVTLASTYIVLPVTGELLVAVPERGGIREAYVIGTMGFLEHPFSDKLVSVRSSYAVEADVSINTDDGKKFIARSQKKKFRVIDPIAVYHRIGEKAETIEEHLRDGIKRCFHSEMSAKQFSGMLAKKTGESFSISSHPCELGLKYYGLEPVGGNSIYFADFRMADILPVQLQIQ